MFNYHDNIVLIDKIDVKNFKLQKNGQGGILFGVTKNKMTLKNS